MMHTYSTLKYVWEELFVAQQVFLKDKAWCLFLTGKPRHEPWNIDSYSIWNPYTHSGQFRPNLP